MGEVFSQCCPGHLTTNWHVSSLLQAERTSQDPKEAAEVQLYMQLPPIEKMDASLSTLAACE